MDHQIKGKLRRKQKRSHRTRNHLKQNNRGRMRLSVFKSLRHLHVQIIDDEAGKTVAGVSTYSKEFRNTEFNRCNKASAKKLGEKIALMAKEKNIKTVVFDRGPYKYHGVLAELADAARAGGLQF